MKYLSQLLQSIACLWLAVGFASPAFGGMIINSYQFSSGGGGGGSDPYFANVSLLAHCNGSNGGTSFADATAANTLTANGNAQTSTAQSKFNGSSGLFDGSGDTVTASVSDSSQARFTLSGDFTIECWFRLSALTTGDIIGKRNPYGWVLLYQSGGVVYCYLSSDNSGWNVTANTGVSIGSVSTATWYYVAVKRSGSTITGHLGTTGSTSSVSIATSSASFANSYTLSFGGYPSNASSCIAGNVAEVRITKGVARDVSTVPTAAFPDS